MKKKKLFILALIIFGINYINAQKIISIEAEGNLESPNSLECISLNEVKNNNNPADILNGMTKCVQAKEYQKAAGLFAIARVYGKYDTFRVKDKTAHQAILMLQENMFASFDENQIDLIFQSIRKELESNSESLDEICLKIKEIGEPTYHPTYMIRHGISAFTDMKGNGLIEDFDGKESFNLALSNYLKCK